MQAATQLEQDGMHRGSTPADYEVPAAVLEGNVLRGNLDVSDIDRSPAEAENPGASNESAPDQFSLTEPGEQLEPRAVAIPVGRFF